MDEEIAVASRADVLYGSSGSCNVSTAAEQSVGIDRTYS